MEEEEQEQEQEKEPATLDGQFLEFAKLHDDQRSGQTITLYRSDYWMRQAHIIDDRQVTMTDTGIIFNEFSNTELNWREWNLYITKLCEYKSLNEEEIRDLLTSCGLPGEHPVQDVRFRDFFLTFKPRLKLINIIE